MSLFFLQHSTAIIASLMEIINNIWNQFVFLSQQPYFAPLLNFASVIVLFITGVVTFLSWRAANHANEIQMLPLLSVYFRGKFLKDRRVRVRNIGKYPAFNIKIESFTNCISAVNIFEPPLFEKIEEMQQLAKDNAALLEYFVKLRYRSPMITSLPRPS